MDDSSQCEDTKQQEMEENAVYEVRATRSSIPVKDPQQGSQVSQERQESEQFTFKPVAHAAHTKMTDIFQPATSKTTDPGVSSDMMAKPQSVVKLRRFGALLNGVV